MSVDIRKDIAYGADSNLQRLDLYLPPAPSEVSSTRSLPPLLAFIHGGAWRSGDKSEYSDTLLLGLVKRLSMPLASLNYRLSDKPGTAVRHPDHELDIESGLHFLQSYTPEGAKTAPWDPQRIYLIGYSAGAFMAFNASPHASPLPHRTSLHDRARIRGLILLESIFDLPRLLDEYPSYSSFVHPAFGSDRDKQAAASPINRIVTSEGSAPLPILIVHSPEDELVSFRQPRSFVDRLRSSGAPVVVGEEYEKVTGGHYEALNKPEAVDRIAEWITGTETRRIE